jgi:transcriptional regulator GlxA family with amidase domain
MEIAIPLFDRMTALDAVGPYEVLWRLPGVEVRFVGQRVGPIQSIRPLKLAHETSKWTTSVCTGALVLGKAGVLQGKRATSHWVVRKGLVRFGATPVAERVVVDGKVITAAGVSAGIDMALTLAALIAGEDMAKAIQLAIEYDPKPPFHTGSLESAPPEIVQLSGQLSAFDLGLGPAPGAHPGG